MRLARLTLHSVWPGKNIRESALALVRQSAAGDLAGALEQAYRHLVLVQAERAQAEAAAEFLQKWAHGVPTDAAATPRLIGQTADLLGLTIDTLRSWERNGLIKPPRTDKGYRLYGPAEIGRLRVIRMLYRSGYSSMAILRMLLILAQGQADNLRHLLDTPRPDEDIYTAADRWLSTLAEQEQHARQMITQLEAMLHKRSR